MKIQAIMVVLLSVFSLSQAVTVYEDAEDGNLDGWRIRGNDLNVIAENVYDEDLDSRVVRKAGSGQLMLGSDNPNDPHAWNNTTEKFLTWQMHYREGARFTIYVSVTTTGGHRFLFYNDLPLRILRHGPAGQILHGLGGRDDAAYQDQWRTYTRDLEADLKDSEPDLDIISVNGFIIETTMRVDNIALYSPEDAIVYSDGSNDQEWFVSDNNPGGASITTVQDPQGDHVHGDVIQLQGSGMNNAYQLREQSWANTTQELIQWKSRYYENYSVRMQVETTQGPRTMLYINSNNRSPSGGLMDNGATIWHDLGGMSIIGQNGWEQRRDFGAVNHFWQTITRDIAQDLDDYQPGNRLLSVNSFEVMGSGLIDQVRMFSRADIQPEQFGQMYEDAEDGNIDGWSIYDATPAGATITNVADATRGGHVIELRGDRYNNGYILGGRTSSEGWNNRQNRILSWSMNYNEGFAIYIPIETTNGQRYLVYSADDNDRGISGDYIRMGLGANAANGTWQSFARDLETDLQRFEANNALVAINGFMVRGSGRFDDIETLVRMPEEENEHLFEDAEDGLIEGWTIYDNTPAGATITNVTDADKGGRVIELSGDRYNNGFMLGNRNSASGWNETENRQVRWSMNYSEGFAIYIPVETSNGLRYMVYSPENGDRGLSGQYIRRGLGANADNGTWQTFTRDLAEDLERFEPGNEIESINGFMIRGSGRLDDISTIN